MAQLRACESCGQMVSVEAAACPGCGQPRPKTVEEKLNTFGNQAAQVGCALILLFIILPMLFFWLIALL